MPVIINGSTGVSGTDGSAGTPAVQGTDGNTGMFFPAADQIAFAEAGVEVMRLDASGNVGIGTTVPGAKVQITDNTFNQLYLNSTNTVAGLRFGNSANTSGFIYYDNGPNMLFSVNNAERARITASGQLLVNSSSIIFNDNAPFQVSGGALTPVALRGGSNNFFMAFWNSAGNSLIGSITGSTGSSTFYNTTSDYRLKANVVPLTDASARVQALKPSRFNFIADPDRTVDGFIAHEAAEVVPEAVHGEKDAVDAEGRIQPQGIDHSKLVPLLTAALQEALTEIAALKARVAALEATP